jgi:hypothetical protein
MLVVGATCNASVDPYALPQHRLRLPSNTRLVQSFHVNPSAVDITTHSEKQELPKVRVAPLPFAQPVRTVGDPYTVDIAEQHLPLGTPNSELVQVGDSNFVSAAASINGSDNKLSVNILLPSPKTPVVVRGGELRDSYGVPTEVFKGHEEYGVPHEEYGPPPVPNVPTEVFKGHEEYGVPHEEYGLPPVTSHRHEEYGLPDPEDHSDVVPTTEATTTTTTSKSYEQKPPEVIHTYGTFYYPVNPKLFIHPIATDALDKGHLFGKLLKLKKHFFGGLLKHGKFL